MTMFTKDFDGELVTFKVNGLYKSWVLYIGENYTMWGFSSIWKLSNIAKSPQRAIEIDLSSKDLRFASPTNVSDTLEGASLAEVKVETLILDLMSPFLIVYKVHTWPSN